MSAVLSDCGKYRYRLERVLDPGKRSTVTYVMLNPSTADATRDDPTIRKCVGFARRWGFGRIVVVNLFAYRATLPRDVFRARMAGEDIVGPLNNEHVGKALLEADRKVAAWGGNVGQWGFALEQVAFVDRHVGLVCLGTTKSGNPRHPLMVSYETPLQDWKFEIGLQENV